MILRLSQPTFKIIAQAAAVYCPPIPHGGTVSPTTYPYISLSSPHIEFQNPLRFDALFDTAKLISELMTAVKFQLLPHVLPFIKLSRWRLLLVSSPCN